VELDHAKELVNNFHTQNPLKPDPMSQTSFGHIFINSLTILTVSTATESSQKNSLINASHVSRQSILAEILGRSTSNHHGTVY